MKLKVVFGMSRFWPPQSPFQLKVSIGRSTPIRICHIQKPMDFPGAYMGICTKRNNGTLLSNMFFKKAKLILIYLIGELHGQVEIGFLLPHYDAINGHDCPDTKGSLVFY